MESFLGKRVPNAVASALFVFVLAATLSLAFLPCGAAEAKQGNAATLQRQIEKGYSRNAKVIRLKSGRMVTRAAFQAACTKARYAKASNVTKVATVQIWGPSGSRYASFAKVKYRSKKQQKRLSNCVSAIARKAASANTQARKVETIHDEINRRCGYDYVSYRSHKLRTDSGNAYGCLIRGRCVCAGYADAFQLVALRAGLKSRYVCNGRHAWNLVRVDGKWYHVDLCWDDTGGDERRYFLKGSGTISGARFHEVKNCYPAKVSVSIADYAWPEKTEGAAGADGGRSGMLTVAGA